MNKNKRRIAVFAGVLFLLILILSSLISKWLWGYFLFPPRIHLCNVGITEIQNLTWISDDLFSDDSGSEILTVSKFMEYARAYEKPLNITLCLDFFMI